MRERERERERERDKRQRRAPEETSWHGIITATLKFSFFFCLHIAEAFSTIFCFFLNNLFQENKLKTKKKKNPTQHKKKTKHKNILWVLYLQLR